MYANLKEIVDFYHYHPDTIANYADIEHYIVDLFNHGESSMETNSSDSKKLFWNGTYYQYVEKDYKKMKKYYEMAIDLKNANAMNNLGGYYHMVEKDYEKMKKYYLMSIDLKNANAMNNLGGYYYMVEKDYEKMKIYYFMAIELKFASAMFNLGRYYHTVETDYEKMKEYYGMAIDLKDAIAMANLGSYYQFVKIDYEKMKKYYGMAIELKDATAMGGLGYYYQTVENDYEKMKKYYLMAIELNNEEVEKICKENNYFYCELIKEKIISKGFTIVEKDLMCPITIDLCHTCYTIKKCGHEFSKEILKVDKCPLCRACI